MESSRLIDRQRLDLVLAETARVTTDPTTRAQVEAFASLLRTRYRSSHGHPYGSVHDEIADFIMPRIANSGILNSPRYMEILGHVMEQILPLLGADDEISGIAAAVIEEEIERHRELRDRIHEALGA